jgi:hypothetical protein
MTMSDEQVVEIATILQKRRLSEDQMLELHQTLDGVYYDIRRMWETCRCYDLPEPVRQPLLETIGDIGCLREAVFEARLALMGDSRW